MKKMMFGALVFLGACGYSQSKFEADGPAAFCAFYQQCNDAVKCEDFEPAEDAEEVECDYDAKAAKACIDGLAGTAECDETTKQPTNLPKECADACKPTGTDDTTAGEETS